MTATSRNDSFLIIPDVPNNLEFGIDCMTYETGPKFKGVSLLPNGIHFVYYGTGLGSRQGFFIITQNQEFHVKSWDTSNEEILPYHNLSEESLESLKISVLRGELNQNLGPYPFEQLHSWNNLSNFLSKNVLERSDCLPNNLIYPGDEQDIEVAFRQRNLSSNHISTAAVPYFPGLARIARFYDIKATELKCIELLSKDIKKAEKITKLMLDKSEILEEIINKGFNGVWMEFLGELQLSYILFLLLFSHPGLEHWKSLIHLICNCEQFLLNNTDFTIAFIKTLYSQLSFSPADFFENELSKDNFLRPVLSSLFGAISGQNANLPTSLLEHKKRLLLFLQKKFNILEDTNMKENMTRDQMIHNSTNGGFYMEDDRFNLVEEDQPMFVSMEEIKGILSYDGENKKELEEKEGRNVLKSDEKMDPFLCSDLSQQLQLDNKKKIDNHMEMNESKIESDGFLSYKRRWDNIDSFTKENMTVSQNYPIFSESYKSDINPKTPKLETLQQDQKDSIFKPPLSTKPLSPAEIEAGLFSWRYPLLYENSVKSEGREDMTMTAVRIMDEMKTFSGDKISSDTVREAQLYLENEVGKRK